MATAITCMTEEGGTFDGDTIEDAFARYFAGVQAGEFDETDTVQFCVRTADPQLPNVLFDFLPVSYLGFMGSYPDVESLAIAEEGEAEPEADLED